MQHRLLATLSCCARVQLPASPCPDLLLTNSVPSDIQLNEIHSFIGSAKAKITFLDDQIAQAQHTLDRLDSQRTELADLVESQCGVVSNIRRLPGEVLGEIFSQYLRASDSHLHSPKALSHLVGVCARWRAFALASPLLWRHICPITQEGTSYELREIFLQLQRSASVALSIHLDETASFRVVDLLLTESSRWQNLCLTWNPSYKHITASKVEFPILEKLTLKILESNLPEDIAFFFESLPAMEDLTLDMLDARTPFPGTLDFIWAQLRTCTLTYCCTTDILHVLPLFSAGTRVYFNDFFGEEQLTSVHTVVSELSIRCHNQLGINILLNSLTAPCLKKFRIAGRSFSIPLITAFFDRSSCALTHLGIVAHWECSADVLFPLLSSPHVRDIVDLDVDMQSTRWVLWKVTEMLAARDIMILPSLRSLALRNCDWIDKAVVKMFEIQSNRLPILRSLWLNSSALLPQDTLHALKSGGLEVVKFE